MIIRHEGNTYPSFQAEGNAAQFAIPFAKKLCKGVGLDIGAGREDWSYPGSIIIDPELNEWDANNLPLPLYDGYDYIFSSHCLEHIPDWVGTLDYWTGMLKKDGVMFLYLPHYSQTYWRPWSQRDNTVSNTPHVNVLTPGILNDYFVARNYNYVWTTGADLNNSFYAVGVK